MTVFLDPEGVPFYGGTYFPPEPRHGMPSFRMVMEAVVESWATQRERIRASAARIRDQLGAIGRLEPSTELLSPDLVRSAVGRLRTMADPAPRRVRRSAQVPARGGARAAAGARRGGRGAR